MKRRRGQHEAHTAYTWGQRRARATEQRVEQKTTVTNDRKKKKTTSRTQDATRRGQGEHPLATRNRGMASANPSQSKHESPSAH